MYFYLNLNWFLNQFFNLNSDYLNLTLIFSFKYFNFNLIKNQYAFFNFLNLFKVIILLYYNLKQNYFLSCYIFIIYFLDFTIFNCIKINLILGIINLNDSLIDFYESIILVNFSFKSIVLSPLINFNY